MLPSPLHYSTMSPLAPPVHDPKKDLLRTAPWYWGNITREAAKNVLDGKPDGSFLVRDAQAKKGEYTLTLMKDGNEKLIKICHMNGNYYFVEKYPFNSVVEMINYYTVNSLKMYNKTLDITLSNPIYCPYDDDEAQPQGDIRLLSDEFIRCSQLLLQREQALDQKKTAFNEIREELVEKKLHQSVFCNAEKMFRSQIALIESFMIKPVNIGGGTTTTGSTTGGTTGSIVGGGVNNVGGCNNAKWQEEHEHMQDNLAKLKCHLEGMHNKMDTLNLYIKTRKEEEQLLERQINASKPELQELQLRKDKHIERLKGFGLTEDDLNVILEMGFDQWKQYFEKASNQPHRNEALWFLKDAKRRDAEELLKDAPTGTFLIRARDAGHYALSIVCKAGIHHCIIYETETGFGFAAPYNIYSSLKKLVEHYASNSLEEHNDTLTTVLRTPVLYWVQNKQHILTQMQEELELEQEQERLAAQESTELMPPPAVTSLQAAAMAMPSSAPIPMTRVRDHHHHSGHDTVDASLGSSETETPPASTSPSNFSTSQ
ncbi:phosphatidylinositol 3-kinase regulatory subunit gamma [Drosophila sulfurigaster albostrigata]|uniref:phosphatidylinositol 3-kinase regulatory subunit gamma n=1 Tax=Drosophila sulfurigaster albostrigata TaxID=89887 RepID=UPI002D2184BD|nr:phosphatidylinositol 3-kinase regulatory subunit gamma [Drosophila sulfurigaster albostrigata]